MSLPAKLHLKEPLTLSLVIPVLNEAEAITIFLAKINEIFKNEPFLNLDIIFINDGSTDNTLEVLLQSQKQDQRLRIVDLSRNFGKEAALSAGLQEARGEVIVPLDVDLQDPPELILPMIQKWQEGYEVVLARRINRDSDSWSKRFFANLFYYLHNKISNPKLPKNVGDFRLIDAQVVTALKQLPESRRFMKGLFAWVGFKTTYVDYVRPVRVAGKTKFNGWKLWNFALEGVTSFSTDPLRIWTYLGLLVAIIAFICGIRILIKVLLYGIDVPGYASLIVTTTFLGGLQLMGIGIIGEYLGRTYIEAKRRPVFLIRKIYEKNER